MRRIEKVNFFTKNKSIIFIILISFIILFKFQYDVIRLSNELQREKNIVRVKQNEIEEYIQYVHLLESRFISLGGDDIHWGCKSSRSYNQLHPDKTDGDDEFNDEIKLLSLESMIKIQNAKYAPNFEQPSQCIKEEIKEYPIKLMCSKYQFNYRKKYNFIGINDQVQEVPQQQDDDQDDQDVEDVNLIIKSKKSNALSSFKVYKSIPLAFEEVLLDESNVYIAPSFGSSWGDFNNDGFLDLYISNHYWHSTLLQNINGTGFKDVSSQYFENHGVGKFLDKHASAWADFNKDGNLDLLEVTGALYGTSSIPNNLYINKGDGGYFKEDAASKGIDYPFARGRTITWLDYDGDGELDAFISSQKRSDEKGKSALFRQKRSEGKFMDVTKLVGIENDIKILFARQTDLDNDGVLELLLISFIFPFKVYHTNNSHSDPYSAFKDVTQSFFPMNLEAVEQHKKLTLNSSVEWVPSPPETGYLSVVTDLAFGDMDRNGWQDIIFARNYMGYCIVSIYYNYGHYNSSKDRDQHQKGSRKTSKLKWEHKDIYRDNTTQCGSMVVGDFDNDRNLDIYLVTYLPFSNSPNVLLTNRGNGNFGIRPDGQGAGGSSFGKGESVTMADFNNDGYLDLLVTNGKGSPPYDIGPVQLFKNLNFGKNWIEIDLIGINENAHGFGSRITLTACKQSQFRDVESGVHFSAQNSFRTHFGLAQCSIISEIKIYWQHSKKYQILKNIEPNQILKITENIY